MIYVFQSLTLKTSDSVPAISFLFSFFIICWITCTIMAPFKFPACKITLHSNDSCSITQHDRQCKSKRKTDNILLQGIRGLRKKLDKRRRKEMRDKRKEGDSDNPIPTEISAEVSSQHCQLYLLLSSIKFPFAGCIYVRYTDKC